jgi:hypothetical protein
MGKTKSKHLAAWERHGMCQLALSVRLTVTLVELRLVIAFFFGSLDHAFSNYDERKTNEMHFQSKPYI